MGWVYLDEIDDEDKRKKLEEKYDQHIKEVEDKRSSYLQQTGLDTIYSGDYSNNSDGFNTAGRNDFAVQAPLWDQIKTTASNMLGNTGYGLGNGLIGFAQNERRNQTSTKILKTLGDTVLNQTLLGLPNALKNIGKSIDSTFKNNEKYQDTKNIIETTIEKNKNAVLNPIDEQLQKQEDINNEKIQQNIDETTNPVGKKLTELAPSIGQMLPSMIPYVGTLYSVGSATDSYYDEAKSRGMNDEQASNYSQLMGGVEGLTEQIGIGKLVKGGKGIAKGTVKEAFKDFGIGVADNFIQEAVIEPISEGVTKATAGDEYLKNDYRTSEGWKNLGKDMLQSGFDGAITAGIMGGVSAGLGKSINVYNKLKNGQQPTLEEYKSAYTEQRENGIDVDGIVQAEFKSRMNQSRQNDNKVTNTNNVNTQTNTQQDIANRLNEIVQNDKYISSEDKQAMIEATNNLASKNQLDSNNTLDAINQIKQMSQLSQEQNDQLDTGKKYLSGRKEIYNKYRNVTDYDNTIVQQAKNTVAQNKQGKRTKEQWLDVAKYIGTNIADKPNSEIQKIAYKSWQEETPNNSATLNKQGQKYVKFMSDDWIDTIYDAVEKQRQKSGYVANNETVNALDNLYNEYTNNQTVQNNIDTSKMNLVDSAKAYNLNGNDETIQSINQKLNDRGIASRFDGKLFTNADGTPNKNINALWRTTTDADGNTHREIVFNPYVDGDINEQKTMQQVTIHEMLHDMAGDEKVKKDLFNLVLEKNKTRDGYSDARNNLDEMYSQVYDKNSKDFKNLVDEEEVADTLAQKLGDQEFINSLNKEKPNVFKRIYNWIVDKLNKFTGSKNEKIYWEDVKNKFENAYRQDYQGQGRNVRYHVSKNFSNEIDKALNNQLAPNTQVKARDYTPKILVENGVKDLPMLITQKHIKSIIYNQEEAKQLNLPTRDINYHGLGKDLLVNAIDNLDNPQAIYRKSENNYIIITSLKDSNNKDIIVPIQIDAKGRYNNVFINENQIQSVYGKNNLEKYLEKNNLEKIYTKKEGSDFNEGIQYSNVAEPSSTNSIPTSNNNVKTTNNNSMQESKNNSVEIQRKAIANKLKDKGAKVDKDGNVTLYHITTKENYDQINKNGYFKANDSPIGGMTGAEVGPRSFFSYDKDWVETWRQSADSKIMEVKVPAEYIRQGAKNEKEIYIEGELKRRNNGTWTTDKLPTSTFYDRMAVKEYLKKNSNTKPSVKESGAWQSFLENQIGPTGKGKTVQELRLPTKENLNTIKQQNIINQNNKERLKDIGITENSDIVTNGNNENIDEEKIANILTEMPTKEKEKSRALAILKANILDKGIVFEELSRKTKNRELQGKWDYTLTAGARGQNAIGKPRYEFDSKTKTQKLISKSLESIREEVGKNIVDFNEYMYHQLNIDRMTLEERFGGDTGINYERKNQIKNKPVFGKSVTAKVSQDIVNEYEKNNPEFKKWAKDIYDFLDANTQELVKTGVISEDTRQLFKEMYPHYVPISRVDNKGNAIAVPLDTRRTGVNSPIKKAKGGNSDIKPLFETIADRTLQTYRASARNNFGVELLNTLQTVQNAEKIDVDNLVEEITNSEDGTLLKKGTGTVPPSFTVFVNGEKVTFEISKDMYDALKPVSEGLSYRNKTLNKISNFRRGVLTEYNPVFMITNSLKDIQDVVVNSQHTAKTISKLPEAYSQILEKGYWYNEYIQNGGEQNSYFNANDGSFENDKKVSMGKNIATMPLRGISKVNNIIEMSPRLAEYIASREKGRSIETSMLDASRVTTNFKAGGNVTKFLNRNGATFLNASVQGAMQQVRNIQEAKVKGLKGWTALACKYAVAGLPVILLNNILWKDDEDYENLQDYVKDSYYCIAKYGDGKFIRIPKGRTTATIQKIISNISEYITDDKKLNIDNLAKDFWEDLQFTMDNLAPNNPLDNNIISPIIQAVTNTSWYGENIVPSRLQDKPAAEQYDESTDKFSKWLGEKLNVSPYKINYLLDQYGGGISDIALPMLTPQAENNMMEDKFTTDSVIKSRYPGEFFEKSDEINVNANSDKATDLDKVKNKYMTNISKEMSKLYEEKRKIENSNVSDDIKKNQLKEVQKEINKLAKVGIEESDKVKVDGNTAKAGNELYYKYHGEWTKLDEDEKEKTKNISLKSYADFKNKIYNETQRQKDSGELEEDKQLKNTTKSKILLDSNYSDKDKLELYKNYVSSTDKKVLVAVEKLGMPIDVYLNYKSNKFENDKDEDGETISGTKKDKVYNYVNSLSDVDLIYKYMMVKMEDINDSYGDRAILNFVNDNKQLDFEERKEVLETLGFEVDKYGNVENTIFIPIKSRIK